MPKFTLICDHSTSLDTDVRTHTFKADYLPDVLEHIEYFLKGAGYTFDGVVDIVTEDVPVNCPCENEGCDCTPNNKSPYYFDTERNK